MPGRQLLIYLCCLNPQYDIINPQSRAAFIPAWGQRVDIDRNRSTPHVWWKENSRADAGHRQGYA